MSTVGRRLAAYAPLLAPPLVGAYTGDALLTAQNAEPTRVLAALHANASPRRPAPRPSRPVVVVLVDGVGDAFMARAMERGTLRPVSWWRTFDTGLPSLSRPAYHALFTGVPQAVAGVGNNRHRGPARADTMMDRVRDAGGFVAWALEGVSWMHDLAGRSSDEVRWGGAAHDVDALAAMATRNTLVVTHWVTTDDAGHTHGAASVDYAREVDGAMRRASALHDALAQRLGAAGFTLFVGADHGHVARGGHGGPERAVTRTRWVQLGGPTRTHHEGVISASAMAATFTDALAIEAPREALRCAAREAVTSDCAAITRRAEAVEPVFRATVREGRVRAAVLSVAWAVVLLAMAALGGTRVRRALAAMLVVLAGAVGAYVLLGPGFTLSAIGTRGAYIARSLAALTAGALVAWAAVGRRTGARGREVLWASAAVPWAGVAAAGGLAGATVPGPHVALLASTAGMVPTATVLAVLLTRAITKRTG